MSLTMGESQKDSIGGFEFIHRNEPDPSYPTHVSVIMYVLFAGRGIDRRQMQRE